MRIDKFISEKYGFTRNRVQQLILAELIFVDEKLVTKASYEVNENNTIKILEDKRLHWVSRSAEKLYGFFEKNPELREKVKNAICLDVGSSTGGFTQVLMEFGAEMVDAVDVGTDQLHVSLKDNPKIQSFENTDIRDFRSSEKYSFIVCDASFISLGLLLESIIHLANGDTDIILLFKPQFEVGKQFLSKNGVPKDEKEVERAMKKFEERIIALNAKIICKEKSTLLGEAGNQEWVYYIKKIS